MFFNLEIPHEDICFWHLFNVSEDLATLGLAIPYSHNWLSCLEGYVLPNSRVPGAALNRNDANPSLRPVMLQKVWVCNAGSRARESIKSNGPFHFTILCFCFKSGTARSQETWNVPYEREELSFFPQKGNSNLF